MKLSCSVLAANTVRQNSEDLASDQSSEDDFCGLADGLKAGDFSNVGRLVLYTRF